VLASLTFLETIQYFNVEPFPVCIVFRKECSFKTYHGNYLEKLRKIVILVHFPYFHDDVLMTYHDLNKNQPTCGSRKNVMKEK
jgi:hypothetical protein